MKNPTEKSYNEIPESLRALTHEISRRMTDLHRFEHTLSVARECLALADIFSFSEHDRERICTAALLHDIAKGLSADKYAELSERYGINFTPDDLDSPAVLHAKAGARIAEKEFDYCTDGEICTSIAQHTTGAENMTSMAKLLFLADYIEPSRKWETCKRVREEFYRGISLCKGDKRDIDLLLDKTILNILELTEAHLIESQRKVHPDAIKCKEFILKTIE